MKPNLPISLYSSPNVKPQIVLKIDKDVKSPVQEPNCLMYIYWINIRKKVRLRFKGQSNKFEAETVYTQDDGAKHYSGMTVLKD